MRKKKSAKKSEKKKMTGGARERRARAREIRKDWERVRERVRILRKIRSV